MGEPVLKSEKTVIVTGGSRGIGQAIVIALAEAGYNVVFTYASNKAAAIEVEQSASVFGVKTLAIQANAGNPLEAQSVIDQTMEKFGRIDALVNNAGITKDGLLMRMSDEDWQAVIDVNLSGVFYTSRAAIRPMMKQRSGAIVNISSISGIYGNAGQTNYSASKAGIIGFTKSLAKEVGSRGITANVIAPGFIATDMTHGLPLEQVIDHIPLKRLGQAEDVAKAVVFLVASGNYITGQVLQVDGGLVV
ncbi:MAG: 3-oxoacyl-[acyl-carrier-protein] reductase [Vampirovibrionales bacterium]|nr:3-oxoacyl-[acyl-carrier-protein] reductase [Vampirovibrionales bacterium]